MKIQGEAGENGEGACEGGGGGEGAKLRPRMGVRNRRFPKRYSKIPNFGDYLERWQQCATCAPDMLLTLAACIPFTRSALSLSKLE